MKSGYKKGVSIVEVGFLLRTHVLKKNGNLSLSKNMIVDADVRKS